MGEKRSATAAQAWQQLDLLGGAHGVGARQGHGQPLAGGGGYLASCTPPELPKGAKKNSATFAGKPRTGAPWSGPDADPREAAMLDELEAMGLSRVMLQVAHAVGFDGFMAAWAILDRAPEALSENESSIFVRMPRLSAYRRYQRNRFIEALVALGKSQPEIKAAVNRDLREEVSDRHIWRLMANAQARVKA